MSNDTLIEKAQAVRSLFDLEENSAITGGAKGLAELVHWRLRVLALLW